MRTGRGCFRGSALAALALASAACGARVTDTGFVGTWRRADGVESTISLSRGANGYHLRWSRRDGPVAVRCEEPDSCAAFAEGRKLYEYRFHVSEREGSSDLYVECAGTPVEPDLPPMRYVDRLVLQPGALELWSFTIERDGVALAAPEGPIRLVKTADTPF